MELLLSELVHLLITFGICLLIYARFRDTRVFVAGFLFGFLIDIDHFVDFVLYYGNNLETLSFLNILNVTDYICSSKTVFVPLHGWEYVPVFGILAHLANRKLKIPGLVWTVTLSYLGHLFIDHLTVSPHPLGYSIVYRLLNGFSLESFNG